MLAAAQHQDPAGASAPAIAIRGLKKSFGATRALRGIDLVLEPGRVHALLGANGCGKSTLVKILAGYHTPDEGEITSAGGQGAIAFVHQDLGLVSTLSVAENISLSTGFALRKGRIDWPAEYAATRALLRQFDIETDPRTPIAQLGPTDQTMIAIARAISTLPAHGGVLVLDEPTARLPASEADRLLDMVQRLKARGVAVLYITHRLEEVMQIADDVTVLRDGSLIHYGPISEVDRNELVHKIVGETSTLAAAEFDSLAPAQKPVLEVKDLQGYRVRGVTLDIHPGEFLGIAGLVGSGRSELGRLIFGLQSLLGGAVRLDGSDVTGLPAKHMVRRHAGYVPQERRTGIFLGLSVAENAILAEMDSVLSGIRISARKARAAAEMLVRDFQVKTAGVDAPIETLSGGNQQKVSIGKWLRRDIRLLILDEPTQGIDIGARTEIFHTIRRAARERGMGVLVLDSDLEILAEHCDRVLVMASGQLVSQFTSADLTISALNHAVYGH